MASLKLVDGKWEKLTLRVVCAFPFLLKISLSGQIRIMHIILGSTKRQISPGSPQQEETSALRQPVICALTAVVKLNGSVERMCGVSVGRKREREMEVSLYDSTRNRRGQTTAFTTAGQLQLDMLPNRH